MYLEHCLTLFCLIKETVAVNDSNDVRISYRQAAPAYDKKDCLEMQVLQRRGFQFIMDTSERKKGLQMKLINVD